MIRPGTGLAILGLGAALGPLDVMVNIALPAISRHFGLALGDVQWLVICYVLIYGTLMLVCGKLGDLFGYRLIFRLGLIVSLIGCAACAAAPSWTLFLAARAVQGVGTALVLSCAPALTLSLYPEERRTEALAAFAGSLALASALGPLLGGVLVALWDWPAVYWVRVPIALLALVASGVLPKPERRDSRFDGWGALLLALWMSAALLAIAFTQRAGTAVLAPMLLAVAVAGLMVFLWHERRFVEPIIRPALFADAAFAVPNAINLLANLATFVILLLTPYYLLNTLGLTVVAGGAILALQFVGAILGAWLAARLAPRFGRRRSAFAAVVVQGLALMALGSSAADTPLLLVASGLIVIGVGQGLLNVTYADIVTGTLAVRDRGVAGSLSLLTRTLGVVTGATVISALHAAGAGEPASFLAGYRYAVTAVGSGLLLALALSCLWRRAWFARD